MRFLCLYCNLRTAIPIKKLVLRAKAFLINHFGKDDIIVKAESCESPNFAIMEIIFIAMYNFY